MIALLLLGAVACATVELASPEEDQAAKKFISPDGQAVVYLTRKYRFEGSAVLYPIIVDGEVAGALAPGTYRVLNLDAGPHQIVAVFRSITASKAIEVEAGNTYFFEVKVLTGWASHRMEINRLSEKEGRQAVNENELAKII